MIALTGLVLTFAALAYLQPWLDDNGEFALG